jgi:hypothetical protein
MTAAEFVDLVRRMRAAQKKYFRERTSQALIESKQLEKQVDEAEITDIHNLVTESPIA